MWTGVITKVEIFSDISPRTARLTAEHHYVDWIENLSIQRERFFQSPRGEGAFAGRWILATPEDQKCVDQLTVGDMLIAYGYPRVIGGDYVGLNTTQNLRAIKLQWYRTDILDYGRPGEPIKVLKTVLREVSRSRRRQQAPCCAFASCQPAAFIPLGTGGGRLTAPSGT